jgi:hypothetical protein
VISQAHAVSLALPGSPEGTIGVASASALDPFRLGFDENGNAFVQIFANGQYGPRTVIKPIVGSSFLTWTLPQRVVAGDVSFAEPPGETCGSSVCSDGLRFTNNGVTSTITFFSEFETSGNNALADTGFPDNFDFRTFAFKEVGPENGLNGFVYLAGPGDPSLTNVYAGISDNVPEPATWALMLLGFAGLGFAAYRRQRVTALVA